MRPNRFQFFLLCSMIVALISVPIQARADVGVIIPKSVKDTPDPTILSLRQMDVKIRVDGQYAHVSVLQIYRNKTDTDIEGKYMFTLPDGAQVSDFAIWEDGVRIPGIIVERKRARELYDELTFMKIDPGLMESGGIDNRNIFSVEIYPIPAQGTKRVEIEYTTDIRIDSLRSHFNFPLKPNLFGEQNCDIFSLRLDLESQFPINNFKLENTSMPLTFSENNAQQVRGEFKGNKVAFTEDFSFEYEVNIVKSDLRFQTYRNDKERIDLNPLGGGKKYKDSDGYFSAAAVFNLNGENDQDRSPRDVVLMVDTSLSMQWDKLEKSYEAIEFFLNNLGTQDRFGLVTFNDEVKLFDEKLKEPTTQQISGALSFFRSGYLMGGTSIAAAVERTLPLFGTSVEDRERYLVLITDGAPTADELRYGEIVERIDRANSAGVKFMVFGIGNDTNTSLLQRVADENGGYFVWAAETEDLGFKLQTFLDKLGENIITDLNILVKKSDIFSLIYSDSGSSVYDRSMINFIGRYLQFNRSESIALSGEENGKEFELSGTLDLPEKALDHPYLPRRWAKLRVNHLLEQIDFTKDEDVAEAMIQEVIALAKQHKFVTPYTSFLAAPRSLLRPRAIKPGDPILRVKTIEGIQSVVAVFPFGLTKPLHYIEDEDAWETRFLAPKDMNDGAYSCILLLSDLEGNLYKEEKEFFIDSRPPSLQVRTDKEHYSAGDEVTFKINADSDTRRILIKIGELMPVEARYRSAVGASVASITLPTDMPPGRYSLRVTAVDFARNTAVLEQPIDVTVR